MSKDLVLFNLSYGSLFINGNGHSVNLLGASKRDEYHFATLNNIHPFMIINNLGISGFNTAIINKGYTLLNNVTFSNNRVKYILDSGDDAGAILTHGFLICNNCTFNNNSGLYAGAICGAFGAITHLNNCSFSNNTNSKSISSDVHSFDNAVFYVNGVEVHSDTMKGVCFSVGYEEPPSGVTATLYKYIDFITPAVSFVTGFVTGLFIDLYINLPLTEIIVWSVVSATLGSVLNIGYEAYYIYSLSDDSRSTALMNLLTHLPLKIVIHSFASAGGVGLGVLTSNIIHYLKYKKIKDIKEGFDPINEGLTDFLYSQ